MGLALPSPVWRLPSFATPAGAIPIENELRIAQAFAVLWILRAYSSTVRAEDSKMGRWRGNPSVVRCKFGERPALPGRPNAEPSPRESAVRCRDHNHPP